jgi:hypothetical protein
MVEAIVSSAATTPQRRRQLVLALPGFARSRAAWLIVGTVLALLGIGAAIAVGSYLLRHPTTLVPAALQADWQPVGTREWPNRTPLSSTVPSHHPDNLDIIIGQTTTTIFDYHVDVLNAASLVGPDRLEIRALNMGWYWHCRVGDRGTYTFSLSSGDQKLTLTPVSDTCAERATILTGDWTRTDIGDLAPGRHVSNWATFDGGPSGQVSYAVPSGWADINGWSTYSIIPRSNASEQAEIRLTANVIPESKDEGCVATRPAVGSTPAAVAAWLATLPGLVVASPTAVEIGGFSGVMVDLSVVPGWTNVCAYGRTGGFDASHGPREDASFVHTFSDPCCVGVGLDSAPVLVVAADLRIRYVLLDRGDGQPLVIDIAARDNSDWDRTVADAMAILQSFEFTR